MFKLCFFFFPLSSLSKIYTYCRVIVVLICPRHVIPEIDDDCSLSTVLKKYCIGLNSNWQHFRTLATTYAYEENIS